MGPREIEKDYLGMLMKLINVEMVLLWEFQKDESRMKDELSNQELFSEPALFDFTSLLR